MANSATDGVSLSELRNVYSEFLKEESKLGKQMSDLRKKSNNEFISAFREAGNYIVGLLDKGFDKVSSSYERYFSEMTAKLKYNPSEYTQMWKDAANTFVKGIDGVQLNMVFDSTDFMQQLSSNLSLGLRGVQSQEKTLTDLISKQLVPSINVSSQSYRDLYKKMGDAYAKNLVGMERLTEAVLGSAEWFEQGGADVTSQMFTKDLLAEARLTSSMSDEQVLQLENNLNAMFSSIASQGVDANAFASMLKSQIDSGWGEHNLLTYTMDIVNFDQLLQSIQSGEFLTTFFDRAGSFYGSGVDRTTASTMNKELGSGLDIGLLRQILSSSDKINQDYKTLLGESKNTDQEYSKALKSIQDTVSVSTQQDKVNTNLMTDLSATVNQYIPNFDSAFNTIINILQHIVTGITMRSILNDLGGSGGTGGTGNLLSRLTNGRVGRNGILTSARNLVTSAQAGTGSYFGGAATAAGGALNFAAGPGALGAGIIWTGVDTVRGSLATGNPLQGLRSGLTGRIELSDDEKRQAEKDAFEGIRRELDFGAAALNAGKGALLGAGIGTGVGGWAAGSGTVIGALIGGAGGFAASLIDQAIENAKYNELADAANAFKESLTTLDDTAKAYAKTTDALNELENEKEYLTEAEYNLAKEKYELDQKIYKQQAEEAFDEATGNFSDLVSKAGNTLSGKTTSPAARAAVEKLKEISASTEEGYITQRNEAIRSVEKEYNLEAGSLSDVLNHDDILGARSVDGSYRWSAAAEDYWNKIQSGTYDDLANQKEATDVFDSLFSELQSTSDNMFRILGINSSDNYTEDEVNRILNSDQRSKLNSMIDVLTDLARNYAPLDAQFKYYSNRENIKQTLKLPKEFRLGAYNIYEDGTPAYLHANEMVLTARSAEMLRSLAADSSNTVESFLAGLAVATNAQASAVGEDSDKVKGTVVVAIQETVNNIYEILKLIHNNVESIKGESTTASPQTGSSARFLRNFNSSNTDINVLDF